MPMSGMKATSKKIRVWVNVFYAPYTHKTRFYLSLSYPTKRSAVKALGTGRHGNKNQTYVDTIEVALNLSDNHETH